jgi:ribosomal protein L18E
MKRVILTVPNETRPTLAEITSELKQMAANINKKEYTSIVQLLQKSNTQSININVHKKIVTNARPDKK